MVTTTWSKVRTRPGIGAFLVTDTTEIIEVHVTVICLDSVLSLETMSSCRAILRSDSAKHLFNLGESLFERLVHNEIEFRTLFRQRRMAPDIRRALKPVYQLILKDHDCAAFDEQFF